MKMKIFWGKCIAKCFQHLLNLAFRIIELLTSAIINYNRKFSSIVL